MCEYMLPDVERIIYSVRISIKKGRTFVMSARYMSIRKLLRNQFNVSTCQQHITVSDAGEKRAASTCHKLVFFNLYYPTMLKL